MRKDFGVRSQSKTRSLKSLHHPYGNWKYQRVTVVDAQGLEPKFN